MPLIDVVKEIESLKNRLGWSWNEFGTRIGWNMVYLSKFRTLKADLKPGWLDYMRAIVAALEAVPVPVDAPDPVPMPDPPPPEVQERIGELMGGIDRGLRQAGYTPAPPQPTRQEVHAMLLPDIAEKLAAEYRELQSPRPDSDQAQMSAEERAGAIWMLGKVAERLGVAAEVKALLKEASARIHLYQPAETTFARTPFA